MSAPANIPTPAPADLVTFTIETEGTPVSGHYHILAITVSKAVNKVPTAKIQLSDGDASQEDFPISNTEDFAPGKRISILAGYHSEESPIFKGVVMRHSVSIKNPKSAMLIVECKDPVVSLTIGRKNAALHDIKDSEAIEELLGNHPDVTVGTIEETAVQHKELLQYQATDWDFILSRAEANGKLLLTDDGTLSVQSPDLSAAPVLSLLYGATILSFDAGIDARDQQQATSSFSWDPAGQALFEATGADPGLPEQGNLSASDLAALAAPESYALYSAQLPGEELQAWADALLLRSRLAKVRGSVSFQGYADVKPGNVITLSGVGERFNGKAFVAGVRHEIAGGNWITRVQFGLAPEHFTENKTVSLPPAAGLLPAISGLQIGKVSQLQEDPDGEDRILVKIPVIDAEDEGIWARVASPDAGENRGAFFRPEIDDEVVLGFLNNDPRYPVVLGMLNSSAKPAPITASDDNHEKGFVTRSELKLMFNDDTRVITLETPNGNILRISDEDGGIGLEDENGNSITMNADGITLDSAKDLIFKAAGDVKTEGVNVESKANAEFKAEGSAGATLSAGGNTTIEGAMVMIN